VVKQVFPANARVGQSPLERRQGGMTSTLRCLRVLELLADDPFELSVSDVAEKLSMAKGSAHRLLATLCQGGLVEQEPTNRRYRLSATALWVGTGFLRHSAVYRSAFVHMQELAKEIEGMVHLAVWDKGRVLVMYSEGFLSTRQVVLEMGARQPVHATALGKAMLAYRPISDVRRIMATGCRRYTRNTICTFEEMKKELQRIRKRGYAINNEELIPGVRAIAAPIRDRRGEVGAAVSVGDAVRTLTGKQIEQYASALLETTLKVSLHLGFRPGSVPLAEDSTGGNRR
jgi:DNA-binding IclR family transcriptional regulator